MEKEYSYLGLDVQKINSDEATVANIITNSNNLSENDIIDLLKIEADKNNLFALSKLSKIYFSKTESPLNEEIAINYLRRIVDDDVASGFDMRAWDEGGMYGTARCDVEPGGHMDYRMWIEDWKISSMVGDAHAKLGYYYKYSDEHRDYALRNFFSLLMSMVSIV